MISVYIFPDTGAERSKSLSDNIFKDPKFEVKICNFEFLPEKTLGLESKKVLNTLINSKKESPDKPVLIVKDTSTSLMDSKGLARSLSSIIKNEKFDLFYLCRWLDDCQNNSSIRKEGTLSLMKTESSQGVQALLFSKEGRDKTIELLEKENDDDISDFFYDKISQKKLDAICCTPNIFEFDITLSENKEKDSFKTMTCKIPTKETPKVVPETKMGSNDRILIVFLLLLILGVYMMKD